MARLLDLFNSIGRKINSKKPLNYPLSAVPLSNNSVGSAPKASKSKLAQVLISKSFDRSTDASKEKTAYFVDFNDTDTSGGDFRIFCRACTLADITFTSRISTSWLGCRLSLLRFHQSYRKNKERFCNKGNYKITRVNSFEGFFKLFVQWRKEGPHEWVALSNNKREKIALSSCSENTTNDPLTCLTKVNWVLSIYSAV